MSVKLDVRVEAESEKEAASLALEECLETEESWSVQMFDNNDIQQDSLEVNHVEELDDA